MESKTNISISINEAYIPYAYVMLTSLFENNRHRDICVYILYMTIPDESLSIFEALEQKYGQQIICLQVSEDLFPDFLPRTSEWTLEVYFRLLLPELLPKEVSRVLQMDVDMIVNGPVDELYDTSFDEKSFIVCKDMSVLATGLMPAQETLFADIKDNSDFHYFNAGIMLLNLDKLRKIISFEDFLKAASEHEGELFAQDQDLLNLLFYGDVKYADEFKFDAFAKLLNSNGKGYYWIKENSCVIHFAGRKPWSFDSCRYDSEKIWWEYAKLTPYYFSLMENTFLMEMESEYANTLTLRLCKEKDELMALIKKMEKFLS